MCYFATYLADEGLASQSIKTYLAAARNMHLSLGFPDLRDSSSLPTLRRIQRGIQRVQSLKDSPSKRVRMPITPKILDQLREHWDRINHPNKLALWGVAALAFAGFFRLCELLPSSVSETRCIMWEDVKVDNARNPSTVRVHLRVSKCNQLRKGVDVFVGRLASRRCPVTTVTAFMVVRGDMPGQFFISGVYAGGFQGFLETPLGAVDQLVFIVNGWCGIVK